ncbi:helix-turn-helix transcriptional regulator [Oscillibacter sp.]|uniref:helix-turn-helix transcriptional regulator n=1 Tax=Oscillibacter sp. TaxID=1945593 RepID=UPI001B70116D|nr:AraC family transcriptional regulator [Oscillibacter sp.]MBP3509568.1 helix-turn-helix transcriptional regulator [Oscillibacter sp.]
MQDPQLQYLVKRNYQPAFTSETMPRLLYVSRRPPTQEAHPRLLHAHPDFVEVLLIDEGSARFLIGDNTYEVQSGDLLVFNSGVVHDELGNSPFGSWCIAVGGLRLPGLRENALIPEDASPVYPTGAERTDLRALYDVMFRYLSNDRPDCEVFCHRLMLALLDRALTITGSTSLRVPANPEPSSLAHQVQEYIDQHFREPLTLQELGEALHASPYYLSHVFKEASGYSPMQYLTRRRIGEAQNLLVETDLPIARIAEEVGYDTQNYFNLQFSKHVGMPPRKFRQSLHGTPEREE